MNNMCAGLWAFVGPSSENYVEINTGKDDHMSANTATCAGGWDKKQPFTVADRNKAVGQKYSFAWPFQALKWQCLCLFVESLYFFLLD